VKHAAAGNTGANTLNAVASEPTLRSAGKSGARPQTAKLGATTKRSSTNGPSNILHVSSLKTLPDRTRPTTASVKSIAPRVSLRPVTASPAAAVTRKRRPSASATAHAQAVYTAEQKNIPFPRLKKVQAASTVDEHGAEC